MLLLHLPAGWDLLPLQSRVAAEQPLQQLMHLRQLQLVLQCSSSSSRKVMPTSSKQPQQQSQSQQQQQQRRRQWRQRLQHQQL